MSLVEPPGRADVFGKRPNRRFGRTGSQAIEQSFLFAKAVQRLVQPFDITWFEEKPVPLVFDDLGNAADVRADHRHPRDKRLAT